MYQKPRADWQRQARWKRCLFLLALLGLCWICVACDDEGSVGQPPALAAVAPSASDPSPAPQRISAPTLASSGQRPTHADIAITPATLDRLAPLTRWGNGQVADLAWAPDGQTIAVASSAGLFRYDAQTLSERDLTETNIALTSVAYSADGLYLAAGGEDGSVFLWPLAQASAIRIPAHSRAITDLAFTPDSTLLASASADGSVKLWRVLDSVVVESIQATPDSWTNHNYSIDRIAFSPNGQMLAIEAGRDNTTTHPPSREKSVHIWQRRDQQVLLTLDVTTSPTFAADNSTLIASTNDRNERKVGFWHFPDGQLIHSIRDPQTWLTQPIITPDGQTIATQTGDRIDLWRASDGVRLRRLSSFANVAAAQFSPDGTQLAIGSSGTITLWDSTTGRRLYESRTLNSDPYNRMQIAFTPDGRSLIVASSNTIGVWNIANGLLATRFEYPTTQFYVGSVDGMAISPDGTLVAVSLRNRTIKIQRITDGEEILTMPIDWWAYSIRFAPDGQTLALVVGASLELRHVPDGRLIRTLSFPHPSGIPNVEATDLVAWSPDGQFIAAQLIDNAGVWGANDGALVQQLPTGQWAYGPAWSPDGRLIASASGLQLRIWQATDGKQLLQTSVERGQQTIGLTNLLFSADQQLLLASTVSDIIAWRSTDGQRLRTIPSYAQNVGYSSLALSPDGTLLAASMNDGTIRLWGIKPDEASR
jgi:WD40 repeat protein